MLQAARSQLGYTATSTHSKYNTWYGMDGYWCAIGVSWVAAHSGNSDIIPRHAYTPTGAAWFKTHGRWHAGPWGATPGAIVYFSFGRRRIDHVGIFEGYSNGRIVTIDFNTGHAGGRVGGQVLRRVRDPHWVVGYGSPAYTNTPTPVSGQIEVDGIVGPATTRALQKILHTPIDGVVSGQNRANARFLAAWRTLEWGRGGSQVVTALQRFAGASADGYLGPDTVRAVQRMNGVNPDGYFGPVSARAFQTWINYHLAHD